jgi:hypothetical protein
VCALNEKLRRQSGTWEHSHILRLASGGTGLLLELSFQHTRRLAGLYFTTSDSPLSATADLAHRAAFSLNEHLKPWDADVAQPHSQRVPREDASQTF